MIIGSGMSYHNGYPSNKNASRNFNNWLINTMSKKSLKQSIIDMMNWIDAPNAIDCHPREEHLLPLHVCLGSNINVKSIDKLFKEYETNKKINDDDDNDKFEVKVYSKQDVNIEYSDYVLL